MNGQKVFSIKLKMIYLNFKDCKCANFSSIQFHSMDNVILSPTLVKFSVMLYSVLIISGQW